jgi:hypothetical protein
VQWTFATTNTDGTPLTDLAGARVYLGTSSSNYTAVYTVPGGQPGETVRYSLTPATHGIKAGTTYYLNGTAYNLAGLESDFANEVSKACSLTTAPGNLRIIDPPSETVRWRQVITLGPGGKYTKSYEVIP